MNTLALEARADFFVALNVFISAVKLNVCGVCLTFGTSLEWTLEELQSLALPYCVHDSRPAVCCLIKQHCAT